MIDGFIFYKSYYEGTCELSDEERGQLYVAIMDYVFTGNDPELKGTLNMAFKLIKPTLDANIKRREGGKKGGRPKKAKAENSNEKNHRFSKNENHTFDENQNLKRREENSNNKNKSKRIEKEKTPTESKRKRAEGVMEAYNMICTSLPKARSLTEQRIRHVNARLEEHSPDDIRTVFDKAQASRFLSGKVKEWRADFDWLINANNFVKVLEGRYDDRDPLQSTYEQDMAEILQGADPEELARAERILT